MLFRSVEQLSGNFHKYIVSSHEKKSLNNAIELLGETIFVYLSDNLSIKGIVFTIRNIYYYTRCSGIPKDITGFLHSFTIGDVPFINVYERQDTETFSLYGWKYNDNYIYTTVKILEDSRFNNIDVVSFKRLYDTYIKSNKYGKYSKLTNLEIIVNNLTDKKLLPRMEQLILYKNSSNQM